MGFSFSSSPNYLYHHTSSYIFRLCVPVGLRTLVGKTEFRYSLKTGSLRVAKQRARLIATFIHQLFQKVRTVKMSQDQINQAVRDYIRQTLENDEKLRAGVAGIDINPLTGSPMSFEETESMITLVNRWLKNNDHSIMEPLASSLLADTNGASDDTLPILSRELLKAFKDILGVRLKRSTGDYSETDAELIPRLHVDPSPAPQTITTEPHATDKVDNGPTFSELQEMFFTEMSMGENWVEKTKVDHEAVFRLFQQVHGADLPVSSIDCTMMSQFKTTLMQLPPNMNKLKMYREKSIQEIVEMKPEKTLAPHTINKYLNRLSGLFNYAARNGHMPNNPADGLKIRIQKRPDQERQAYTQDELKTLFNPLLSATGPKQDYMRWAPLIALFTGCRLEEVCQLHLEDIREQDGVWLFDINDHKEKHLKNMSSIRLVPMHPRLIELGLLEYAQKLRAEGHERLFPELRRKRDGYGQTVSKWFQDYRKKQGITAKGKTFHSFRHTFITQLKHAQVDPFMIHEIDGHSVSGSETMGRYGKRFTPEILLKEAIEKLDYGL